MSKGICGEIIFVKDKEQIEAMNEISVCKLLYTKQRRLSNKSGNRMTSQNSKWRRAGYIDAKKGDHHIPSCLTLLFQIKLKLDSISITLT